MPMPSFKAVTLIPVYNHPKTIEAVVQASLRQNLPVILVDDGSNAETAAACDRLACSRVTVIHRPVNGGKGAAMISGFMKAIRLGYTHAIQIDADGQLDAAQLTVFARAAEKAPDALICGYPQYDETVPAARLWGRKLTNFWVAVNSLSLAANDAMCGMRCYPLAAVAQMQRAGTLCKIGRRMTFDPEILVRLIWLGLRVKNLPVRVTYPEDGVSHFRVLQDNLELSGMHTKLCCLMLTRFPLILATRFTGWSPIPGAPREENLKRRS